MDRFREAELSQASELAAVLDEIKKTEARIKYKERDIVDLEQHISGVEFRTKELEAERKVAQDFNGKCQAMIERLDRNIGRSKRMTEAVEVPFNNLLKMHQVLHSDIDQKNERIQVEWRRLEVAKEEAIRHRQALKCQTLLVEEEVASKTASQQAKTEKADREADKLSRDLDNDNKALQDKEKMRAELLSQLHQVQESLQAREDSLQQQETEEARLDCEISRLCGEACEMEGSVLKEEEAAAALAAEAQAGNDEASAMAANIEDLKVEVHGLNFTLEAKKDLPLDLEAAKGQLATVEKSVKEAAEKMEALKEAPLRKMVMEEIRDKQVIAGQVADRRSAENEQKEEFCRMGDAEIAELTKVKESLTKEKCELEASLDQLGEEGNSQEADAKELAARLASLKKSVASTQEVLDAQVASMEDNRLRLADLASAAHKRDDLQSQLDAIDSRRKAKRDDYETTNQSFLAEIKSMRETIAGKKEAVRSLELEVNVLDANLQAELAANKKAVSEAKDKTVERVGAAVDRALHEKATRDAEHEKAAMEKAAMEKAAAEKAAMEKAAAEKAAMEKAAAEKAAAKKAIEEKAAAKIAAAKKAAEEKAAAKRVAEEKAAAKKAAAEKAKAEKAAMEKATAEMAAMEMEAAADKAAEERVAAAVRAAAESAAAERAAEAVTPKPGSSGRKFRGLYSAGHTPVEIESEEKKPAGRKASLPAAAKRVSFAKSVAKSPCYTANPISRAGSSSALGGRKLTPVRPILHGRKDGSGGPGSGGQEGQDTPVPRSAQGRRTLSAAATKKQAAAATSKNKRTAGQKTQKYFGFSSSEEDEDDLFLTDSRFAKKKPAPIPLAKRLSAASTPAAAKSPYKIFGSKNSTPTKKMGSSSPKFAADDSDF